MSASVRIPTPLRPLTGGAAEVPVAPGPLSAVLTELDASYPGLGERVLDESGALRRFVNVYVGDDDVRFLSGLDTEVAEGASVSIVPAVAGG
ncbi:MAG TPA: MoaD/ThiS family protein [Frankiaceae bacterium]|jgi:molybdopterin converting factor small subunit|nr:MoaD/ThiS family protein [Frankiaceae bacterium]